MLTGGAAVVASAAGAVLLGAANAEATDGGAIVAARANIASRTTSLNIVGNASGAHGLIIAARYGYGFEGRSISNHGVSGVTGSASKAAVLATHNGPAGSGAALVANGKKNSGGFVYNVGSTRPALVVRSSSVAKPIAFRAYTGNLVSRSATRLNALNAAAQVAPERGTAVHGVGGSFGVGVQGESFSEGPGVYGISHSGNPAFAGVEGSGHFGAYFFGHGPQSVAMVAVNDLQNVETSLAIRAVGDVEVHGTLASENFASTIDHPLRPSEQYLSHASVESPDMKNIYDGVATANASGEAVVSLPEWFDALNEDFRYQLTPIGKSAPSLYVKAEVKGNRFSIGGANAGQRVSWQVTGIRKDVWAAKNRVQVERDKPRSERGTYLFPQGFGKSASKAPLRERKG